MTTIFKYSLQTTEEQLIQMPRGAEILTVQMQNGVPCIWAVVNDDLPKEDRRILTIGTGHPMPSDYRKYIGTYQVDGYQLVFHVFELINR